MRFLLKTPALAAVVTGSIKLRLIKKAKTHGASLIELRLDTFDTRNVFKLRQEIASIKAQGLRVLLTVRSKKEGGKIAIAPKERLMLFTELITAVDMVDIELSSGLFAKEVIELARKKRKKTIVSFHNFKGTPSTARLEKVIKEAREIGADTVKIAAFATKKEDVRRLARTLLAHNDLIIIAMGAIGQSSRITFPLLGSLVTYGSISESTAPGQMPIKELNRLLTELS